MQLSVHSRGTVLWSSLYTQSSIYIVGINMSSTKEQRIKEQEVTTTTSQQQQVQQREHQQAINKALDETKDNIRRTTDEARKDIPRYTQIVN